jgi:hypothetical protein
MSVSIVERILSNAFDLAEQHLRAEGRIAPMLYLSGPGGEAVLRLDLSPAEVQEQLFAKAGLMATALEADVAAWVFESLIVARMRPAEPVVVVLIERASGGADAFARIDAESAELSLRRIESPLAASGTADGPTPLARFLRRTGGENAAADAWRELEEMGVSRSDGRRPLN